MKIIKALLSALADRVLALRYPERLTTQEQAEVSRLVEIVAERMLWQDTYPVADLVVRLEACLDASHYGIAYLTGRAVGRLCGVLPGAVLEGLHQEGLLPP